MNIIHEIESSYLKRCNNPLLQKSFWEIVCSKYPPEPGLRNPVIPSKTIASGSGDLGLAMLWIVQASLVRGIMADTVASGAGMELFGDIGPATIGALAHNDDRENPLLITGGRVLNGCKRYITGGSTSDIILVTAKKQPDEKTSKLFALRKGHIPTGALAELDPGSLHTVSHGRLTLENYTVNDDGIIPLEGKDLRRSIKRWSIIERSLIMQSFLGLITYLDRRAEAETGAPIMQNDPIDTAVRLMDDIVEAQVAAALGGTEIVEKNPDFRQIMDFVQLCNAFLTMNGPDLPADFRERFADLNFMQKKRP